MLHLFLGFHPVSNLYGYQHGVGYAIPFDHFKLLFCGCGLTQDDCSASKYGRTQAEGKGGVMERGDYDECNRFVRMAGCSTEVLPLADILVVCLGYAFGQACCAAR